MSKLRITNNDWVCLYNPLRLSQILAGNRNLVGTYFYCTPPPPHMLKTEIGKKNYTTQNSYYMAIQKLDGIEVKFGNLSGNGESLKEKNLDTQLTADMISMSAQNKFDTAILVSSDGDYISAINPTKDTFGKKIEIVYFKGHASTSLWRLADVPRKARTSFFEKLEF